MGACDSKREHQADEDKEGNYQEIRQTAHTIPSKQGSRV